jgi:hypothetical protein
MTEIIKHKMARPLEAILEDIRTLATRTNADYQIDGSTHELEYRNGKIVIKADWREPVIDSVKIKMDSNSVLIRYPDDIIPHDHTGAGHLEITTKHPSMSVWSAIGTDSYIYNIMPVVGLSPRMVSGKRVPATDDIMTHRIEIFARQ